MNNKNIMQFFKGINREVSNARTTKALRILDKRCRSFISSISGEDVKNSIKKQALIEYKKTKSLIEKKNGFL